jgi:hypothetical protein
LIFTRIVRNELLNQINITKNIAILLLFLEKN